MKPSPSQSPVNEQLSATGAGGALGRSFAFGAAGFGIVPGREFKVPGLMPATAAEVHWSMAIPQALPWLIFSSKQLARAIPFVAPAQSLSAFDGFQKGHRQHGECKKIDCGFAGCKHHFRLKLPDVPETGRYAVFQSRGRVHGTIVARAGSPTISPVDIRHPHRPSRRDRVFFERGREGNRAWLWGNLPGTTGIRI